MKINVFSAFFLIYFIYLLKTTFSITGETIEININDIDKVNETTKFSKSKDMAQCTCDLTNDICDFRCCCDRVCMNLGKSKTWKENGECIDKVIDPIADYRCKSKEENFKYNKNATTMHIKDHIHNIMCVKYDRSGEKGEFYLEETDKDEESSIRNNWIENFIGESTTRRLQQKDQKDHYKYGEQYPFFLYKSGLDGKCVDTKFINFLQPIETTCFDSRTKFDKNGEKEDQKIYGEIGNEAEITYIIYYKNLSDNNYQVEKIEAKILKANTNIKHFYVKWKKTEDNNRDFPKGYLQGKPVRIAKDKENNNKYSYNINGFFVPISDGDGNCIINEKDTVNIKPILYKRNITYSCKYADNTYDNNLIYTSFTDKLQIGKYANSKLSKINDDWIEIENKEKIKKDPNEENIDIKIDLIFATSKKIEEHLSYEYIEYAKLKTTLVAIIQILIIIILIII